MAGGGKQKSQRSKTNLIYISNYTEILQNKFLEGDNNKYASER